MIVVCTLRSFKDIALGRKGIYFDGRSENVSSKHERGATVVVSMLGHVAVVVFAIFMRRDSLLLRGRHVTAMACERIGQSGPAFLRCQSGGWQFRQGHVGQPTSLLRAYVKLSRANIVKAVYIPTLLNIHVVQSNTVGVLHSLRVFALLHMVPAVFDDHSSGHWGGCLGSVLPQDSVGAQRANFSPRESYHLPNAKFTPFAAKRTSAGRLMPMATEPAKHLVITRLASSIWAACSFVD